VKVTVDLRDRRARIVTPTTKGRRLQQRIAQTFAETEERWKAAVGPRQWATFRKVLGHLAEDRGD
jgi:DNA-binding MarR family transcriptional regulator